MASPALLPLTLRRLERSAATHQATGRIPSLVTGVVRDGELVWSSARGTFAEGVDPLDLQYRIGSITKTFVAVAVLRLRDAGRLRLTDPIGEHVPGTPFADRTIAQLLTHTGGIAAEPAGSWWERSPGTDRDGLRTAMPGALHDRAGRYVHYSNLGFAVLGELVERLTDRPWHVVVADEILIPLGMRRTSARPSAPFATGYAVHPHADVLLPEAVQDTGAMGPAGQLWSTLPDLARWAAFVAGDTGDVLSPDSLEEMCEPIALELATDDWEVAKGLGFETSRQRGRRLVGHGGSMPGFQAGLRVHRATRTGVVLLMNCTTPTAVTDVEDPFDVLDECEPVDPPVWVPQESVPADLLALTGAWFWGTSEGTLRVLPDGRLQLDHVSGMLPTSGFRRTGEDTWVGLADYFRGETMRVVRDAQGAATHLDIGTFVLTRRPYEPGDVVPGGMDEGGWPVT